MEIEKQSSKGGHYVGGFLQLFDWSAKSQKKLFSGNPDLQEKSKQKKRFDGTLPTTGLQTIDEDETAVGSSLKGSSDYSCASPVTDSSVTDEDVYGSKGPGVVARLMGLDSMPKSSTRHPYSPRFDCQSLPDSYCESENLECHRDPQIMQEVTSDIDNKHQKVKRMPVEKYQAEILPLKSAMSIPITHHKLLTPIKSTNLVTSKDAAARIIEPKTKLRLAGSSSEPLQVKDLKEKVQAAQKPMKMSGKSSGVKHIRGHSMNKSSHGSSVDAKPVRILQDSEESSSGVKSKGKSISLALQAKENVQKREALNSNISRAVSNQVEKNEFSPKMTFTNQSGAQKSTGKRPSTQISSNVLRQNNQKQNCSADKGKLHLKSILHGGKAVNGDLSHASKLVGKLKDDARRVSPSSSESTRKKKSIPGNYQSEKNQAARNTRKDKNGKVIQSSTTKHAQSSSGKDYGKKGTDVISFTFTSPMRSSEVQGMLNSDCMAASKFPLMGHSVEGDDTLSFFLEQQLKELAHKLEFSRRKLGAFSPASSNMLEERHNMKDLNCSVNLLGQLGSGLYSLQDAKGSMTGQKIQGLVEEKGNLGRNISEDRTFLNFCLPSPVSVLEHSSFAASCNSSDSADSNHSTGSGNKSSPLQFQNNISQSSMNTFLSIEGDAELTDSASSASCRTVAKRGETALTGSWEFEYVKKILCNIDQMFNDYAMGRACKIIDPHLFCRLESHKPYFNDHGPVPRMNRMLLFDCVSECIDWRCRKHAIGGFELWAKGVWVIKRKERLAEDLYGEISDWGAMGDFMVDELVDNDMSSYGRWLDHDIEGFELRMKIESRILSSLIDEVVDILMF